MVQFNFAHMFMSKLSSSSLNPVYRRLIPLKEDDNELKPGGTVDVTPKFDERCRGWSTIRYAGYYYERNVRKRNVEKLFEVRNVLLNDQAIARVLPAIQDRIYYYFQNSLMKIISG